MILLNWGSLNCLEAPPLHFPYFVTGVEAGIGEYTFQIRVKSIFKYVQNWQMLPLVINNHTLSLLQYVLLNARRQLQKIISFESILALFSSEHLKTLANINERKRHYWSLVVWVVSAKSQVTNIVDTCITTASWCCKDVLVTEWEGSLKKSQGFQLLHTAWSHAPAKKIKFHAN